MLAPQLFGVQRRDGREQIGEELATQTGPLDGAFGQRLIEELGLEEVLLAGDGGDRVGLAWQGPRGGTEIGGVRGEAMGAAKQTGKAEKSNQAGPAWQVGRHG